MLEEPQEAIVLQVYETYEDRKQEILSLNKEIADRVEAFLTARKITNKEFAEGIGCEEARASKLRKGTYRFDPLDIKNTARFLGVPVSALIGNAEDQPLNTTEKITTRQLAKFFYRLYEQAQSSYKCELLVCGENDSDSNGFSVPHVELHIYGKQLFDCFSGVKLMKEIEDKIINE